VIDKIIEQQETIKGMQENEESAIKIMKMYEDYKLRVDRAIEYIKENKIEGIDDDGYSDAWFDYVYVRDLLNILQGEDKE